MYTYVTCLLGLLPTALLSSIITELSAVLHRSFPLATLVYTRHCLYVNATLLTTPLFLSGCTCPLSTSISFYSCPGNRSDKITLRVYMIFLLENNCSNLVYCLVWISKKPKTSLSGNGVKIRWTQARKLDRVRTGWKSSILPFSLYHWQVESGAHRSNGHWTLSLNFSFIKKMC